VEFSRFDLTGWRATGLHLNRLGRNAGAHLRRLCRSAWLNLSRLGLGARYDGLPRSRLGRCRFERLRLRRLEPLFRRQLLDLLGHLGVRGMVALVGNAVPGRPPPAGRAAGWTRGIVA